MTLFAILIHLFWIKLAMNKKGLKFCVLKQELVKLMLRMLLLQLYLLKITACLGVIGILSYNSTLRVEMDGSTNTWTKMRKANLILVMWKL